MEDKEFGNRLFAELRHLSGGYLPWPATSGHERVQYLAYAGRWLCPEYVFKWPQIDWFTKPAIMDDFLADKPEKMLAFASGGGFMMKGTPTAAEVAHEPDRR